MGPPIKAGTDTLPRSEKRLKSTIPTRSPVTLPDICPLQLAIIILQLAVLTSNLMMVINGLKIAMLKLAVIILKLTVLTSNLNGGHQSVKGRDA